MKKTESVIGTVQTPKYARTSETCYYLKISRSTLWQWVKTRRNFPQPIMAGPRVRLFDLNAIEAFLSGANKQSGAL
jgi:predicted DNA-binding transcriptional regulator AlpA